MDINEVKQLQEAGNVWNFRKTAPNYDLIEPKDEETEIFIREHKELQAKVGDFHRKYFNPYFVNMKDEIVKVELKSSYVIVNGRSFYYKPDQCDGIELYFVTLEKIQQAIDLVHEYNMFSVHVLKRIAGSKTTYYEERIVKLLSWNSDTCKATFLFV